MRSVDPSLINLGFAATIKNVAGAAKIIKKKRLGLGFTEEELAPITALIEKLQEAEQAAEAANITLAVEDIEE